MNDTIKKILEERWDKYKLKLEEKWGKFEQKSKERNMTNCPLKFISKEARLNAFFSPEPEEYIQKIFKDYLKTEIPLSLQTFYSKFNGCRLFFSSLNVYGVQYGLKGLMPYDLFVCNNNSGIDNKNNLVYIASIGGNYDFGFKRDELTKIYGVKVGSDEIVQTFNSFEEFFDHYFNHLFNEYDKDGKKLHPNEKYKDIPVLYHMSYDLID